MRKRILKNLFASYLARITGLAAGFLLVPFLLNKLGKEAFGITLLAESLIVLIDFFSLNMRSALSRQATFALSGGKHEDFTEYLSTGRYLLLGISLIFLAAGTFLCFYGINLLNIPQILIGQSRALFFIMTLALVVRINCDVFWTILYAKHRFDLIYFSNSFGFLTRTCLVFIAFSVLPGRYVNLAAYGVFYFLFVVLQSFIIYFWSKRVMPHVVISLRNFKKDKIKKIAAFGTYLSLSHLGGPLADHFMQILVNILWGPAFNAVYGVSTKFSFSMSLWFVEQTSTLVPTFTHLAALKEREKSERIIFAYSKLMAVVSMPLAIFLILAAGPVIHFWVGPGFELAAKIMPLQVLPLVFIVPGAASVCMITAHAKVKVPAIVNVCSIVARIGLALLLAIGFSMGLYGLALGSFAVVISVYLLFTLNYACHVAGISIARFWRETYLKPLCLILPLAATGYFALYRIPTHAYLSPFVFLVLGTLAAFYLGGAYFFLVDRKEREDVRELWRLVKRGFFRKPKGIVLESPDDADIL